MTQKTRLSRTMIADAALGVAHRDGLDRVTLRSVAAEVGASPMALYRHFASKDAMLDYMLERVIERVFVVVGPPGTGWRDLVIASARQARRVLGAHPNWVPLLTRTIAPASAIDIFERIARSMDEDGVSPAAKLDAINSLMCFTLGFVLVERLVSRDDGKVVPIEQLRLAREAGLGGFPRLAELAPSFADWSFDRAFETGLGALVGEIRRARAAS